MSFSYDFSLSRNLDKVRLLIQDTDKSSALYQDEEILGVLGMAGSVYDAAAMLVDGLVARFAGLQESLGIGDLRVAYGKRVENYRVLAIVLRSKAGIGMPIVEGISISAEESVRLDPDREPSRYNVGQGDFPGRIQPQVPQTVDLTLPP